MSDEALGETVGEADEDGAGTAVEDGAGGAGGGGTAASWALSSVSVVTGCPSALCFSHFGQLSCQYPQPLPVPALARALCCRYRLASVRAVRFAGETLSPLDEYRSFSR